MTERPGNPLIRENPGFRNLGPFQSFHTRKHPIEVLMCRWWYITLDWIVSEVYLPAACGAVVRFLIL